MVGTFLATYLQHRIIHWVMNDIKKTKSASPDIALTESFIESLLLVMIIPPTVNES